MATPLYYEEDKQNFPMNDLGLFTHTNLQGKILFFFKRAVKSQGFAYDAVQSFTITRHWHLTKTAFSN